MSLLQFKAETSLAVREDGRDMWLVALKNHQVFCNHVILLVFHHKNMLH